ncbi:unnamed protein product [Parajaminaea phylloscopi]
MAGEEGQQATSVPSVPTKGPAVEAQPLAKSFNALKLSPALLRSLSHLSITQPTPIQSKTIPTILSGYDLIGGSPTGTGKTMCFALPILHSLLKDPVGGHSVVLTPTRELAVQLHEQFLALAQGAKMGINISLVLGGMDMIKQATELSRTRPHVIVATPGRLWDLLVSGGNQEWSLERCKFLVLDEADRMLTPTFAEALGAIMEHLPAPAKRQTLLFSATLTPEIQALATARLAAGGEEAKPIKVETIEFDTKTPENLKQRYIFVPSHVREVYLHHLLTHPPSSSRSRVFRRVRPQDDGKVEKSQDRESSEEDAADGGDSDSDDDDDDDDDDDVDDDAASEVSTVDLDYSSDEGALSDEDEDEADQRSRHYYDPVSGKQLLRKVPAAAILFVSRCRTAEMLARTLRELGIPCLSLHSQLPQRLRLENLQRYRAAPNKHVLVATDVASRGLDIPEVDMVVNYDLPAAWEDYLHRVGRTARAGRKGWAVSFVGERDVELFRSIEAKIGLEMTELQCPEERVLEKLNRVATAKRVANMELADGAFGERAQRNKDKNASRSKPSSAADGERPAKKSKRGNSAAAM